jgi:predicted DNA-binding ribbon-helix-helix protein
MPLSKFLVRAFLIAFIDDEMLNTQNRAVSIIRVVCPRLLALLFGQDEVLVDLSAASPEWFGVPAGT